MFATNEDPPQPAFVRGEYPESPPSKGGFRGIDGL